MSRSKRTKKGTMTLHFYGQTDSADGVLGNFTVIRGSEMKLASSRQ